jgi:hypothetical protein
MSQDPGSFYEDEYWEMLGRQEDIAAELKRLSEGPIREYLGSNGDAIDGRLDDILAAARYASQGGFPRFAVTGAVTAIELVISYMLVRPLIRGAFLSNSWAEILTKHIFSRRVPRERDLLPSLPAMYDIKIDDLKLEDGSSLWQTLIFQIIPKRNAIVHAGENASPGDAKIALECATTLRKHLVAKVAAKLGFNLEQTPLWHQHVDGDGYRYRPTSPFS